MQAGCIAPSYQAGKAAIRQSGYQEAGIRVSGHPGIEHPASSIENPAFAFIPVRLRSEPALSLSNGASCG